jgi:signal transduction histidine kinase
MSSLAAANKAFRNHQYEKAIELYEISKKKSPELAHLAEKNIKLIKIFDENIPTILIGDSMRLGQIMLNLLGEVHYCQARRR